MNAYLLSRGSLVGGLVAILIATASGPAHAFCPKNGFVCFIGSKSAGSKTHQDATQIAIEERDKSYFAVTSLTASMQKALDQIIEANAEVDEDQISSAKHFDGENGSGAQARIATLKQNILDALNSDPINATGARKNFGSALHTIQDFYSHSNWVESGNSGPSPDVGRSVSLPFAAPTQDTCVGFTNTGFSCANSSNLVTSFLTSGYYGGEDRLKPTTASKCSHGGPFDKSSPSSDIFGLYREGINKDTLWCDISPHSGFHNVAANAAIEGTKQFLDDLKSVITMKQLKALLGVGPALTFAIDTTGSMGSVIAGVRSTAISIVDARLGTDEEPLQYVLSPFNDPSTGPVTVTSDANIYKSAISGLTASGGGDCPELSMSGVYSGLAASDEGGDLFLFTDASSKDASLAGTVAGLAKKKDIQVYPVLFGSCSPIDPAYLDVANETGGQVFFLNRSEAANVTQLADLTVRNNAVQILSVVDQFASPKTYSIPVDPSLKQLTVSVSSSDQVTLPKVTLTRPDGTPVVAGAPIIYITLSRAVIISVPAPSVGLWNLRIEDSAIATYVNVSGVSNLKFSSFNFADIGGQPPHQGLFNIQGSPVAGQSLYAVASLTQGFATAAFQLRRKNFDSVLTMSLEGDETDFAKFFGKVTIPVEKALAYVNGTDAAGNAIQRVVPVSIEPQTVTITAPSPQDLRPGKTTTLVFQVTNYGAAGNFNFSVTDDKRFITAVTPSVIALSTGESANVSVQVTPPLSASIGSADTLSAAVQSATTPSLRNNTTLTLYVTGAIQTHGKPNFIASVVGQSQVSPGVYAVDVRFTNTGPGTAKEFSITNLKFRSLIGSGTVTYNSSLAPTLPLDTPNIDAGSYFKVRLMLNVPSTVKRFSVAESGSVQDIDGGTYTFSQAQALLP